jgi:hypothetical protein
VTTVTRTIVLRGIAAYFGGTEVPAFRCWQGGPLMSSGLGTVKAAWPKDVNDKDYHAGLPAGRNMGALMIVDLADDNEIRRADAGPPVTTGGVIVSGGIKFCTYQVTLHCFHLGMTEFSEDSQADVDTLIEAIKQLIRQDRTLGMQGTITQAGEGRFGIKTHKNQPGITRERTKTYFTIRFEILTSFIA